MGAWGFKAWESDAALDWLSDFNKSLKVDARLQRAFRSKHEETVRAAVEWAIRADKAGILHPFDMHELAPLAIKRLEKAKERDDS